MTGVEKFLNSLVASGSVAFQNCPKLRPHGPRVLYQQYVNAVRVTNGIDVRYDLLDPVGTFVKNDRAKLSSTSGDLNLVSVAYYWGTIAQQSYYPREFLAQRLFNERELVVGNYLSNAIANPLYFLFVDHTSKSIVIAVRGTMSDVDWLSDAMGDMVQARLEAQCVVRPVPNGDGTLTCVTPLEDGGTLDDSFMVHRGFWLAASSIVKSTVNQVSAWSTVYPNYTLKAVGHSYGAAVSSLVAAQYSYYVSDNGKFPNITPDRVKAICFACPPVWNKAMQEWACNTALCTTFVLGWDIVPRASLANIVKYTCDEQKTPDGLVQAGKIQTYCAGSIYWLVYDEIEENALGIFKIAASNPALLNIELHRNMIADHSMSKYCAFLLGQMT